MVVLCVGTGHSNTDVWAQHCQWSQLLLPALVCTATAGLLPISPPAAIQPPINIGQIRISMDGLVLGPSIQMYGDIGQLVIANTLL